MHTIDKLKRMFTKNNNKTPQQAQQQPVTPTDLFFSDRLFWGIKTKSKRIVSAINRDLMPILNDINVKDEDLFGFIGKSYRQLEDDLADYLAKQGMPKKMAIKFVMERLEYYHKRRESTFDPGVFLYNEAPAEIPEPILPYIHVKREESTNRIIELDVEAIRVLAMVRPTEAQKKDIKLLQNLADAMNDLKKAKNDVKNGFMRFLINSYTQNRMFVDEETVITGIDSITPYLDINLYNLVDLTKDNNE